MHYTIIIPIHNEESTLPILLNELEPYSSNNQILFIDDGSTDSSNNILKKTPFINLITLEKNYGKGVAIKKGIFNSKFEKLVIFDGDLELKTTDLNKLMVLDFNKDINCAFGQRYHPDINFNSIWNFGNFVLTKIFNYFNNSYFNDALCCAVAFYKNHLEVEELRSKKFDIDVEIKSKLLKRIKFKNFILIKLHYMRRTSLQGKKLKIRDGFSILRRIIFCSLNFKIYWII